MSTICNDDLVARAVGYFFLSHSIHSIYFERVCLHRNLACILKVFHMRGKSQIIGISYFSDRPILDSRGGIGNRP